MKKATLVALILCASLALAAQAGVDEGLAAYKRGDYATALKEWRPVAEAGNPVAQEFLGGLYENGFGVSQNGQEAVKWYRAAAEQGFSYAQYDLGRLYQQGTYITQDYKEAVRWYRLAAEQGNVLAQYVLGMMYQRGQGVPQDYREAVKWYRLAAEQGYAGAQNNLGAIYAEGLGVARDNIEAVRWYRKAADQGDAVAQGNLGAMYLKGLGVPQDYIEAAKWFRLAAEQGDAQARFNLGLMFESGAGGLPKSNVIAYALYNLGAGTSSGSFNVNTAETVSSKAEQERNRLTEKLEMSEIEAGQALTRELAQPGNFGKALEAYLKKAEAPQPVAPTPKADKASAPKAGKLAKAPTASAADDLFPPAPARTPGRVSCSTRCINADCWRTYDDGRKVKLRAKSKWNPFENRFEWDAGPC
jgi:hypothetical protein